MNNETGLKTLCTRITDNISHVIVGKQDVIEKAVICLICSGHILIEDMPGTGKTTLAKALAASISGSFKRIQFTPDLLPSELTGLKYLDAQSGKLVFRKGVVFTNILLADEINRATPRTQSALLECMEERQVTDQGNTYSLDKPFLVIATQNPVETQGTFRLPEAQLDRFLMRLSMGYPDHDNETAMIKRFVTDDPLESIQSVVSTGEIADAQNEVRRISISNDIMDYIVNITELTRNNDDIRVGASPRATLALARAAQGKAALSGRSFVTPDDVKYCAPEVLAHRIIPERVLSNNAQAKLNIINQILSRTAVPAEQV
ncbi:MAG: MoxR family ATPase [Oscillospiraceae bacterium]|nr:MoxR family ATPase [Oscillospiraceae bacterium]